MDPTFEVRMITQMGHVERLLESHDCLPADADGYSLAELDSLIKDTDRLYNEYLAGHTDLEANYPDLLIGHEYVRDGAHFKACEAQSLFRQNAEKLRSALVLKARATTRPPESSWSHVRLPAIPLPKFKGGYAEWLEFSDLFASLVLKNSTLTDALRLYYLRECLEGEPASLISYFRFTGESLEPSWKLLVSTYERKLRVIQSHLDKMFSVAPLRSENASGLQKLIDTVWTTKISLRSLGVVDLGECILVHHVARHLDSESRRDWEMSHGSKQVSPTFRKLEDFMGSRIRALRMVERYKSAQTVSSKCNSCGSSLPLVETSPEPSGELPAEEFENKLLKIQSHLNAMFSVTPLSSKSASGLEKLVNTVSSAATALRSLGVVDLGECILVHHVERHLDDASREAWIMSLFNGSSQVLPTFKQLQDFMAKQIRILQMVECNRPARRRRHRRT